MSMTSLDVLRARVDALRSEAASSETTGQRIHADLAGAMAAFGVTGSGAAGGSVDESHPGMSAHMCPWDTCQATRHN